MNTVCTEIEHGSVVKFGTELDSVNDIHLTKLKNNGAKQVYALSFLPDGFFSDVYFSLYYQTYKDSIREYDALIFLGFSAEAVIQQMKIPANQK